MDEQESMRELRELDKGTEWSVDGNMLSANDEDDEEQVDDDGMAGVPAGSGIYSDEDTEEEPYETVENICDATCGLAAANKVEDIITIVNLRDGTQLLFTTLQRNDHIIGMLTVATMNWHSSQIAAQNFLEE